MHLPNTKLEETCSLLRYYAASSGKKNYHYSLRKNREEHSSYILRGGSLKSPESRRLQLNQRPHFPSFHSVLTLECFNPYPANVENMVSS